AGAGLVQLVLRGQGGVFCLGSFLGIEPQSFDSGLFDGHQVTLDQQRRNGQRAGVVVETVAALVGWKVGGGVVVIGQIEQVAGGVGVLAIVEAVDHERSGIGHAV